MFEPSERMKRLYELLSQIPPEYDAARQMLEAEKPGEEELAWLAIQLTEDTFDDETENRNDLYCKIALLLEHGLNPNTILDAGTTEADNVMMNLKFLYGADVGASVMRLLLEQGGDPNLNVEGWTPLSWIDADLGMKPIIKDVELSRNFVQCIMVIQAYGGKFSDGKVPFAMHKGYSSAMLKELKRFDYFFGKGQNDKCLLHIFNKATGEIVADYI